jgi:hypothetical protein
MWAWHPLFTGSTGPIGSSSAPSVTPGRALSTLQARSGNRVVSVSLEKEQSALLAEKIEEILDELMHTQAIR